jgi:hypothetical protein
MTAPTTHLDAAALLGVPVAEISDVATSPAGTVIVTTDGVSYIDVPASSPDSDGKTGLMYLSAPAEKYTGSFPVYALPAEPDDVKPAKQAAAAVTTALAAGRVELVARAKELGLTINGRTKTETIAQLIADKEAALAAEDDGDGDSEDGDSEDGDSEDGDGEDGDGDGDDQPDDGEGDEGDGDE